MTAVSCKNTGIIEMTRMETAWPFDATVQRAEFPRALHADIMRNGIKIKGRQVLFDKLKSWIETNQPPAVAALGSAITLHVASAGITPNVMVICTGAGSYFNHDAIKFDHDFVEMKSRGGCGRMSITKEYWNAMIDAAAASKPIIVGIGYDPADAAVLPLVRALPAGSAIIKYGSAGKQSSITVITVTDGLKSASSSWIERLVAVHFGDDERNSEHLKELFSKPYGELIQAQRALDNDILDAKARMVSALRPILKQLDEYPVSPEVAGKFDAVGTNIVAVSNGRAWIEFEKKDGMWCAFNSSPHIAFRMPHNDHSTEDEENRSIAIFRMDTDMHEDEYHDNKGKPYRSITVAEEAEMLFFLLWALEGGIDRDDLEITPCR